MLELELKSVVDDPIACRERLEHAGATHIESGHMTDRRYDAPNRTLGERDEVLRTRWVVRADGTSSGSVDWKGATHLVDGYKAREELSASADVEAIAGILRALGYVVTQRIDRDIDTYELGAATVRFEHYPRMDVLVEVEGEPVAIEHAITVMDLPRDGFTSKRLRAFAADYEARTGLRAALSVDDLAEMGDE